MNTQRIRVLKISVKPAPSHAFRSASDDDHAPGQGQRVQGCFSHR